MKPTKKQARAFASLVLGHAVVASAKKLEDRAALDAALSRVSAFRAFADLAQAQRDHGYVPTLRTDAYRGKRNAGLRQDVLRVRAALRAAGLRAWPDRVEGEA